MHRHWRTVTAVLLTLALAPVALFSLVYAMESPVFEAIAMRAATASKN